MMAGWRGLFAVEKDSFAFDTLRTNLASKDSKYSFEWPAWLPKEPLAIDKLLSHYEAELLGLKTRVDMLVGGPPCQGFSMAGRRDPADPRNQLFTSYLRLVSALRPRIVLIENVRGMASPFSAANTNGEKINYADKLIRALSSEYVVHSSVLNFSTFGVPQNRKRLVIIGIQRQLDVPDDRVPDMFDALESQRSDFLRARGLGRTGAQTALSDLEVRTNGTRVCEEHPRFLETRYTTPKTPYQRLMHAGSSKSVSDTRLARHAPEIEQRFKTLIAVARKVGRSSVSVRSELHDMYGSKKQAMRVLDPSSPAPTITSLPDDLLHYSEPRTLTVRENARLQSFPDWFRFQGKYTTGGFLRKREVPRFTQVANAVPPLVACAIGELLLEIAKKRGVL